MQDLFNWSSVGAGLVFFPLTLPVAGAPLGQVRCSFGWHVRNARHVTPTCVLAIRDARFIEAEEIAVGAAAAMVGVMMMFVVAPMMSGVERYIGEKELEIEVMMFENGDERILEKGKRQSDCVCVGRCCVYWSHSDREFCEVTRRDGDVGMGTGYNRSHGGGRISYGG